MADVDALARSVGGVPTPAGSHYMKPGLAYYLIRKEQVVEFLASLDCARHQYCLFEVDEVHASIGIEPGVGHG